MALVRRLTGNWER